MHIYETGKYPNAKLRFLPTLCMHCEEPACERACPTGATVRSKEGIVLVDDETCIGCGYCVWACPYGARTLNHRPPRPYHPALNVMTPYEEEGYTEHPKGHIEKCDFCELRLKEGREPACVETCPASARTFGDLDDPDSEVSRLLVSRKGRQRLPQYNTKPSVYYLDLDV